LFLSDIAGRRIVYELLILTTMPSQNYLLNSYEVAKTQLQLHS